MGICAYRRHFSHCYERLRRWYGRAFGVLARDGAQRERTLSGADALGEARSLAECWLV